jgi:hypothetical protein
MASHIICVTYYPSIAELSLYVLNGCRMTKQRITEIALCVIKCRIRIIKINFNLLSLVKIHVFWNTKCVT